MKKAWNIPSLPVYSLVTKGNTGYNMNICTYVSAVSMIPKRYCVGVYKGTMSLENAQSNQEFVLQLLHRDQFRLVRILGQKSGLKFDKIAYLNSKKKLETWDEFPVLKDAMSYIRLKVIENLDAGDHIVFLCDVLKTKTINDCREVVLTTGILSNKKIIRV
jgi:flavin reductase (DIM6/NTAB) family NADH-FMN oxidoreductase RutF